MFVYAYVHRCWWGQRTTFSFDYFCMRDWTQVAGLCSKHLYLPSHATGPGYAESCRHSFYWRHNFVITKAWLLACFSHSSPASLADSIALEDVPMAADHYLSKRMFMCACASEHVLKAWTCFEGLMPTCVSWFSLPIMWVPEGELRSSGLLLSVFLPAEPSCQTQRKVFW